MIRRRAGRFLAAVLLALPIVVLPRPAFSYVRISVEWAFGSVVVGGVGIFVYAAGSWEYPLVERDLPTALVEFRGRRPRLGIPLVQRRLIPGGETRISPSDGLQLDLVRWRF